MQKRPGASKYKKISKYIEIFFLVVAVFFFYTGLHVLVKNVRQVQKESQIQLSSYQDSPYKDKRVLLWSFNDPENPNTAMQLETIQKVFAEHGVYYDMRFADKKALGQDFYTDMLKFFLKNSYPYDVTICMDPYAADIFIRFQDSLLKGKKGIFYGLIENEIASKIEEEENVTAVFTKFSVMDTLSQAMDITGNRNSLVFIMDGSEYEEFDIMQLQSIREKYSDLDVKIIQTSKYSEEDFKKELAKVKPSDLVLYSSGFSFYGGRRVSPQEMGAIVQHSCQNPVFRSFSDGIGDGFAGGVTPDYYSLSKDAAEKAILLLNGADISSIPMEEKNLTKGMYDCQVFRRFKIPLSKIPKDAVRINNAETFFHKYRIIISPFILIFIGIASLLVFLVEYGLSTRRSKNEFRYLASHDRLTGLPNRNMLFEKLSSMAASKNPFSVLLLDIEDFKSLNDFFSHETGDLVLKEIADRLSTLAKDGKFFASRVGADEFFLIYKNGLLEPSSRDLFMLKELLNSPCKNGTSTLFVKVRMGIVNTPDLEILSAEEIYACADIANHEAKKKGKSRTVFFASEMKKNVQKDREISRIVEDACQESDGFKVLFQPQVDTKTGKIHGYEALCRLAKVAVPPGLFIPVAEEGGFIAKIGRIVTEKVVVQLAQWRDHGKELHQVAINFSAGQLGDAGYVSYLKDLLEQYNIDPSFIEIEITESLFLGNSEPAMELFNALRSIGVKLALDDFGTGYSSLSYLTYLPVETIKIDKTMTDAYLIDGKDDFMKNLVRLVHSLGMTLTIEGVEEKWQKNKAVLFHCDYIQGYYYSKPVSGDEIENWIPQD